MSALNTALLAPERERPEGVAGGLRDWQPERPEAISATDEVAALVELHRGWSSL